VFFEYDPKKSQQNLRKHGIDFKEVQRLWEGPYIEFAARKEFENRFALIGPLKGKLFTCIFTVRNDRIRIISCRRARQKEIELYEKNIQKT